MYHVSAEAGMKVRVFTKDYFQSKLDDSSLDFTKSLINSESNTYYQTNPRTSGNINFLDWLKTLKEGDKKAFCRVETLLEYISTAGKIITSGNGAFLPISDSAMKSWSIFRYLLKWKRTPKKVAKRLNWRLEVYFCSNSVFNLSKKVSIETEIRVLEKGLGFASRTYSIRLIKVCV